MKGVARARLLETAIDTIRGRGYAATTVDALCAGAGVTKGAFFHHFKSKDDLAVAAAAAWSDRADAVFAAAPFRALGDPADRVLGYVVFRKSLLRGEVAGFTCLAGTMVQEAYETHPAIRAACAGAILGHAATVEADIALARDAHGLDIDARGLSLYMQAVIQGAFILAKATGDADVAAACLDQLHDHLERRLRPTTTKGR